MSTMEESETGSTKKLQLSSIIGFDGKGLTACTVANIFLQLANLISAIIYIRWYHWRPSSSSRQ